MENFIFCAMEAPIADEDDPFKDLQNKIDALRNLKPDLVTKGVKAISLTDFDEKFLLCNHHIQIQKF